jgi:hypothetical protein
MEFTPDPGITDKVDHVPKLCLHLCLPPERWFFLIEQRNQPRQLCVSYSQQGTRGWEFQLC